MYELINASLPFMLLFSLFSFVCFIALFTYVCSLTNNLYWKYKQNKSRSKVNLNNDKFYIYYDAENDKIILIKHILHRTRVKEVIGNYHLIGEL